MKAIQLTLAIMATVGLLLGTAACGNDDDDDSIHDDDDDDDDDTADVPTTTAWVQDVWGSSSGDVFAVGYTGLGAAFRLDGDLWRRMDLPGGVVALSAIWGFSATDVFAAGGNCDLPGFFYSCDSVILHFDGVTWTRMEIPTDLALLDLWGASPSAIWAVGGSCEGHEGIEDCQSIILRYDGRDWFVDRAAERQEFPFRGIWGTSPANVFAVAGDRLLRFDGTVWTLVETLGDDINEYEDVWGTATDLFLVGYDIRHYDGTSWRRIELPGEAGYLHAVWGDTASEIFAVGDLPQFGPGGDRDYVGTITRFDGESFETVTAPGYPYLTGIWGRSPSDVYAVGLYGILHYDGVEWTPMGFAR